MIPVRLHLKNFMCYGENVPALSFEGIHGACLCGGNGNGKSAIFDAITWAIWGKSRSDSDDNLIHFGQTEMQVELEFLLADQKYRVIRKRSRKPGNTKPGQSILDLQIHDENTGYVSISGNTIAETQDRILELLHMDYQTFVNSAFLRQGHSNEFSIKTPAKRKAILASILGLEIYDRLEARAREQALASRNLADSLNINIANIADLLQSAHEYEDEAVRLSHSLSQIEEQKKIIENRLEEFRQNKAAIESKKEKLSYLKIRIADNQAELQEWEGRLNARLEKLLGYEELLNNSQKIEDNYQIYIKCKEQEQESNLKLQKLLALQERIREYENKILLHRQKVQIDLGKINNNISVNEEKHDQLKMLEKEQAELMEDLKCIVESEKELLLKYE